MNGVQTILIDAIRSDASNAIKAAFPMRNNKPFLGDECRNKKSILKRKLIIREYILMLRILSDPSSHNFVMSRVTCNGTYSGRCLESHALRNLVILGGLDAKIEAESRLVS